MLFKVHGEPWGPRSVEFERRRRSRSRRLPIPFRPGLGMTGGSHLRGPPVSGRWWQAAAGARWGAGVRGARLLHELGRAGEGRALPPFFSNQIFSYFFLAPKLKQGQANKSNKINAAARMHSNMFLPYSSFYLIL